MYSTGRFCECFSHYSVILLPCAFSALGKSFRVRTSMPCMPPNLQTLGASSGLIRSPREDPFRYPLVILDSYWKWSFKNVIFHSYVSLSEDKPTTFGNPIRSDQYLRNMVEIYPELQPIAGESLNMVHVDVQGQSWTFIERVCKNGVIPSGYSTVRHGKWPIYRWFSQLETSIYEGFSMANC